MFQFPGFAFMTYVFSHKYLLLISASPKTRIPCKPTFSSVHEIVVFGITEIEGGFPHSEIRGSKLIRSSPRLIAAYHVLHRLCMPRHPPIALISLDRSHCQCSSLSHHPEGMGRCSYLLQLHPIQMPSTCSICPSLQARRCTAKSYH